MDLLSQRDRQVFPVPVTSIPTSKLFAAAIRKHALTDATLVAPTLFIVGGDDDVVLELNRRAYKELRVEKELAVIPGATHLFEEPGALEEVAFKASEWFTRHLPSSQETPARSKHGAHGLSR